MPATHAPSDHPRRLTVLTLAAAAAGAAALALHWACALLVLPLIMLPKLAPAVFAHGWQLLAQLTGITFAFGLLVGAVGGDVVGWATGEEGALPLMQAYLCLLVVYHYFEFQLVNCFHHSTLRWDSFLIYHSKPYMAASAFMLAEHLITKEWLGLPYKNGHPLVWVGLGLMLAGEGLRVAAFFTCRHNFTHLVRYRRVAGHELVTNGVYAFFRHPSYTGYYYFSVGGQLFLGNFLSSVLFAVVLTKFFRMRIEDEELALASFFPEYPGYQQRTWVLMPFVHGVDPQKFNLRFEFEE